MRRVERRSGKNESPGPDRPTKKVKKQKKRPGKKLAVAKPCIFAQQSASHAANAAKKEWGTPFSSKATPHNSRLKP